MPELTEVSKLLQERGDQYGDFMRVSRTVQQLKNEMRRSPIWFTKLNDEQREALEMIATKIGRILNGDPNYADNWIDIAGYATLVTIRLEKK